MKVKDAPLMEVRLHKLIHHRWPGPVFAKIGINDPGYLSISELFLKEGRRLRNEKSHFWISIYYELEGFGLGENGVCQAEFLINKNVLCMLIEEDQELSLKDCSEETLNLLKAVAKSPDKVEIKIDPVESVSMPRISSENGSRGAVIEDGYWRFVK